MENLRKIQYRVPGVFKNQELNNILEDANQRLTLLEESVFKKAKRLKATEPQRFLIAFHLGFINPIIQLNDLMQKQKDLLVSVMLDIDPTNAKKFLLELSSKERPLLNTISNYTFLVNFFESSGLQDQKEAAEKVLLQIERQKEEEESKRKK